MHDALLPLRENPQGTFPDLFAVSLGNLDQSPKLLAVQLCLTLDRVPRYIVNTADISKSVHTLHIFTVSWSVHVFAYILGAVRYGLGIRFQPFLRPCSMVCGCVCMHSYEPAKQWSNWYR